MSDMTNGHCPSCDSRRVYYNEDFDFWTCEDCGEVWSDGANGSDYDEDDPTASRERLMV